MRSDIVHTMRSYDALGKVSPSVARRSLEPRGCTCGGAVECEWGRIQESSDHILSHLRNRILKASYRQRSCPCDRSSGKNRPLAAGRLEEKHVGTHQFVCQASHRRICVMPAHRARKQHTISCQTGSNTNVKCPWHCCQRNGRIAYCSSVT